MCRNNTCAKILSGWIAANICGNVSGGKNIDFNFTSDSFLWASCYFKKISIQLNLSISTVLTGFKKSGYFGKYQAESKGPGCPDGI